uniref:Uncharacterized protein n=1 Tax=Macaca fascicularis TaxID=9541 RepID=A0A7N9IFZ8_MACFA
MFGGFPRSFFTAYHRKIPKAPGFDQRLLLYQLFNYLNHWNHFGRLRWHRGCLRSGPCPCSCPCPFPCPVPDFVPDPRFRPLSLAPVPLSLSLLSPSPVPDPQLGPRPPVLTPGPSPCPCPRPVPLPPPRSWGPIKPAAGLGWRPAPPSSARGAAFQGQTHGQLCADVFAAIQGKRTRTRWPRPKSAQRPRGSAGPSAAWVGVRAVGSEGGSLGPPRAPTQCPSTCSGPALLHLPRGSTSHTRPCPRRVEALPTPPAPPQAPPLPPTRARAPPRRVSPAACPRVLRPRSGVPRPYPQPPPSPPTACSGSAERSWLHSRPVSVRGALFQNLWAPPPLASSRARRGPARGSLAAGAFRSEAGERGRRSRAGPASVAASAGASFSSLISHPRRSRSSGVGAASP